MNDNTRIGVQFYELLALGDLDRLLALVSEDYVGHGLGGGGRQSLRDDLEAFRSAFGDLAFSVRDTVAEGDRVVVRTVMHATHSGRFAGIPASGNPIRVAGTDIWRIEDGRIAEGWTLCDTGTLFRQMGAIPEPAPVSVFVEG